MNFVAVREQLEREDFVQESFADLFRVLRRLWCDERENLVQMGRGFLRNPDVINRSHAVRPMTSLAEVLTTKFRRDFFERPIFAALELCFCTLDGRKRFGVQLI